MAVTNTNYQNSYTGDGSTTTFSFNFRLIQASDLVVLVNGTAQTGLTVSINQSDGVGGGTGGTVTLPTAPAAGATVEVTLNVNYLQNDVFLNNAPLDGPTVETALDYLTLMVQQLARQIQAL